MTRREFLQKSIVSAASVPLLSAVTANRLFASPDFDDYKAIVIVQLDGGNDAFNTFIPTDTTHYKNYANARKRLAVANINLAKDPAYTKVNGYYTYKSKNPYEANAPANPSETDPQNDIEAVYRKGMYKFGDDSLGINGVMPEFAALYEKKVLSIVSNVGTLVQPTSKSDIEKKKALLPLFLFAHDHQRRAVQTAYAQARISTGWLGRVADSWSPINGSIGLNVSFFRPSTIVKGEETSPLIFGTAPDVYSNATLAQIIEKFAQTPNHNIFEALYKRIGLKAKEISDAFKEAWKDAVDFTSFSAKNSYGEALFSVPDPQHIGLPPSVSKLNSAIFKKLQTTAKFIKIGKDHFGFTRQVFYITMRGYDFHSAQPMDHLQRLRSLSLALSDFYKALEEMGLEDKVVLATTSDFGRTLLSNGDGTDHGWGGHQFILCGDKRFQGGKILGEDIQSYELGSESFYPSKNSKGRLIPTTSIEQMFAPILDWFGVDENTMAKVFPNLSNFATNGYKSAFLQGVFG